MAARLPNFVSVSYTHLDVYKRQAVDRGGEYKQLTVDPAWVNLADDAKTENNDPAFINEVVSPINAQDGDLLPVSAFKGIEDGTWYQGTAK